MRDPMQADLDTAWDRFISERETREFAAFSAAWRAARIQQEGIAMSEWRPIAEFDQPDRQKVDVWMRIYASPRSFGMSDAFRVPDAWRVGDTWWHIDDGKEKELYAAYITHWMPTPDVRPSESEDYEQMQARLEREEYARLKAKYEPDGEAA